MTTTDGRRRTWDIVTLGSVFGATFFSFATILPNLNENLRGSGLNLLVPAAAGAIGAALVVAGIRQHQADKETTDIPSDVSTSRFYGLWVSALGGILVVGSLGWATAANPTSNSTVSSQETSSGGSRLFGSTTTVTTGAALSGTTTATTIRALPFTDDFSSVTGWTKAPNSGSVFEVDNGQYRMILRPGAYQGVWSAAPVGEVSGSVRVSFDARPVGDTEASFGAFCEGGPGNPPRPVYTARIDRTGAWIVWRFDAESPQTPRSLASGINSSILSNGVNRLQLDCVGDGNKGSPVTLRFSVNEKALGEAHDAQGLGVGRVGLHILSSKQTLQDSEIQFDNVTVSRI